MIERVLVPQLTDEDRAWLALAAEGSIDEATIQTYENGIASGDMGLWRINNAGLLGLTRTDKVLWVEFIIGDDLMDHAETILTHIKDLAQHRRIECLPSRKGMIRLLRKLGFQEITCLMRLEP